MFFTARTYFFHWTEGKGKKYDIFLILKQFFYSAKVYTLYFPTKIVSVCTCVKSVYMLCANALGVYSILHESKSSIRTVIEHGSIKKWHPFQCPPVTHKHAMSQGLSAYLKFLACESSGPRGSRGSTQPSFLFLTRAAPLHLNHPHGPCLLCPENSRKQEPQALSL